MILFAEIILYGVIPILLSIMILTLIGVFDKVIITIHNLFNKTKQL